MNLAQFCAKSETNTKVDRTVWNGIIDISSRYLSWHMKWNTIHIFFFQLVWNFIRFNICMISICSFTLHSSVECFEKFNARKKKKNCICLCQWKKENRSRMEISSIYRKWTNCFPTNSLVSASSSSSTRDFNASIVLNKWTLRVEIICKLYWLNKFVLCIQTYRSRSSPTSFAL